MEPVNIVTSTKAFAGTFLIYRKVSESEILQGLPKGKGSIPKFRHLTFEDAEKEAQRLLTLFPDSTFIIMQEIARVKHKTMAELSSDERVLTDGG